jgi:hypothetical protein
MQLAANSAALATLQDVCGEGGQGQCRPKRCEARLYFAMLVSGEVHMLDLDRWSRFWSHSGLHCLLYKSLEFFHWCGSLIVQYPVDGRLLLNGQAIV